MRTPARTRTRPRSHKPDRRACALPNAWHKGVQTLAYVACQTPRSPTPKPKRSVYAVCTWRRPARLEEDFPHDRREALDELVLVAGFHSESETAKWIHARELGDEPWQNRGSG